MYCFTNDASKDLSCEPWSWAEPEAYLSKSWWLEASNIVAIPNTRICPFVQRIFSGVTYLAMKTIKGLWIGHGVGTILGWISDVFIAGCVSCTSGWLVAHEVMTWTFQALELYLPKEAAFKVKRSTSLDKSLTLEKSAFSESNSWCAKRMLRFGESWYHLHVAPSSFRGWYFEFIAHPSWDGWCRFAWSYIIYIYAYAAYIYRAYTILS